MTLSGMPHRLSFRANDVSHSQTLSANASTAVQFRTAGLSLAGQTARACAFFRQYGELTAGSPRTLEPDGRSSYSTCFTRNRQTKFAASFPREESALATGLRGIAYSVFSVNAEVSLGSMHATIQTMVHCHGSCARPLSRTRGNGNPQATISGMPFA